MNLVARGGYRFNGDTFGATSTMQLAFLVTCDDSLRRRLQSHTNVRIVRSTELWNSLNVNCAPPHAMVLAPKNPLSVYNWRLPDC
jgi:hypothetical protein